jgi:hypothetical protein
MRTELELRGWRIAAEPELTAAAYAASARRGATDCGCLYCANWVAQRERELPRELRALLLRAGVDPNVEAEVWEAGRVARSEQRAFACGWWHFVGQVLERGPDGFELPSNPGAASRGWTVGIAPGQRELMLSTLPAEPIVQIEFRTMLPWVLPEPVPE